MELKDRYFLKIAAAYVRGKLQQEGVLFQKKLNELNETEQEALFELGKAAQFKMHRFKRTMGLPRIEKVLGVFQGIQPLNILDIGTGRGVFLFPLLDVFPELAVTCVDILDHRIALLKTIQQGGWSTLKVEQQEVGQLNFENNQFDVVTVLEVLEHIPALEKAIQDIYRVSNRYVIISVPSKEDDNPEHIHLLDESRLRSFFLNVGAKKVKFDAVRNHLIGIVRI